MAMNPMQRKARNSFLLGMIVTLLMASAVIGFLIFQMGQLQQNLASKESKEVLILVKDIQSGGVVTSDCVKKIKVQYAPQNAVTMNDLGENIITKTALKANVILSADMLQTVGEEIQKDLRLQEYNMITLPSKLENGNYIDIRITFPTGQDYLVVSKKRVVSCDDDTVWLEVSEDEIVMLNNAIVESYIVVGSNLYATKYVEPGLQEKATPTYPISEAVQQAMQRNPNLLPQAISDYNNRIQANDPINDRQSIERILSQYSQDRIENIETGVQDSKTKTKEKRQIYIGQLDVQ